MPELPEVEVICRGLRPELCGRRLARVALGDKPLRQSSSPRELAQWLPGRKLERLCRRGKYLVFRFEGHVTLVIHLGMTGRLWLDHQLAPLPHVHAVFTWEGGLIMAFQDVRRFGSILIFPPKAPVQPLKALGREPFSRKTTPEWLQAQARGRSRPIKNLLLDGRFLAGLGNIYACEALWAAGIHPATPAGQLTLKEWQKLLREIRRLLRRAICRGGTTINDYLNSKGETGLFQLELAVYGRQGDPCRRCGESIARQVQAGRSSFFCPRCQPRHPTE